MADLKFGGITPNIGEIKVGSSNVSKIYQGSTLLWPPCTTPPQPGEVTVCDLIWTKTNSTITATTTGGNIPIVTNRFDWINKSQNNEPCAMYWKYDPNNAYRGLLYNVFATGVIQPPTGFRLPTMQDFSDLFDCASIGSPTTSTIDATTLGNNCYGFWPSVLASEDRFGDIEFQAIGAGYRANIPNAENFVRQGIAEAYWQQQSSLPASSYKIGLIWYNSPDNFLVGYDAAGLNDGYGASKEFGSYIRFVKDVPVSTVDFYFNDTQTGTPTTSIYLDGYRPGNTQGLSGTSLTSNASFEITGGPATIKFVAYTDVGTAQPPLARYATIRWRIYDSVNRLNHQIVSDVEWEFATAGSDSWPIIPSTPSSTLGFSVENWGTEPGSVTLNPGVYYIAINYSYGNSNISGGNVGSNYRVSFEVGP